MLFTRPKGEGKPFDHVRRSTRPLSVAAGFLYVIFSFSHSAAMPTYRYAPQNESLNTYQADLDAWAALNNDPLYRASFDRIFNARTLPEIDSTAETWEQSVPDRALSRRDRQDMRSLYESLRSEAQDSGPANLAGLGGNQPDMFGGGRGPNPGPSNGTGDLLGELRRNADGLFADAARDASRSGREPLLDRDEAAADPNAMAGAQDSDGQSDSGYTISLRPRAAAPGQLTAGQLTVQSLANTPLGTLGIEALKPILFASGMIADSLDDLRQYVLIEQPKSSMLMMLDNGSGQAVVMQTNGDMNAANDLRNAATDPNAVVNTPRIGSTNALDFLNKPFKQMIWDIVSSNAALVIYILLFVAWLAWRKVISRHV